jgi:hypothetical protein
MLHYIEHTFDAQPFIWTFWRAADKAVLRQPAARRVIAGWSGATEAAVTNRVHPDRQLAPLSVAARGRAVAGSSTVEVCEIDHPIAS